MSYYASNYYSSNYYLTTYYVGTSGGGSGPIFTSDTYYNKLGELGYKGSLADRQFQYLRDLGYTGPQSTRQRDRLRDLGYPGPTASMLLKQKTDAEGFRCISEMMTKTGLIPV